MHTEMIPKSRFKAKTLEYFRQVESSGDPLIITDKGQPCIEVRRYQPDEREPLERLRNSVISYPEPFESVAEGDWEAMH